MNTSGLRISVITPNKNSGPFLTQAAASVDRQSPDLPAAWEHWIVDGGSDDDSLASVAGSPHRQVLRIKSETAAAAINHGLRHAQGDVIGLLSADDIYLPGALATAARFFADHDDVDVLYGHCRCVDVNDEAFKDLKSKRWSLRRIRRKPVLRLPAVFLHRRVIDDYGLLDESLHYYAPYEYWLRLALGGAKFRRRSVMLGGKRIHGGNRLLGTFDPAHHLAACDELLRVVREKTGRATIEWAVRCGALKAMSEGHKRDGGDIAFDIATLKHASQALRDNPSGLPTLGRARLLAQHASVEGRLIAQRPRLGTRLLPRGMSNLVRTHLQSRIFKLRHHAPRPCRLPAPFHPAQSPPTLRISIVTPSFNQGPYLKQTIASVVEQGYPQLEYIVQDGGSQDCSVEVLRGYEPQLASWESKPDRGQTHAINLGMRRATGDILAYLNSDDLLLPGSLHYVADYFQRHPKVDVVYGNRVLIDEAGQEIGRWVLPRHDHRTLAWSDYIPQETMFWRRRAWEAVGGAMDESFQFALDWDLILRFRDAGMRFVRLPRLLGAFRIMDSQKTSALIETVGRQEMNRLRRRALGFVPDDRQVRRSTRRYVRNQWVADRLFSLGWRRAG